MEINEVFVMENRSWARSSLLSVIVFLMLNYICLATDAVSSKDSGNSEVWAQKILRYYERMSEPKPFVIRQGEEFKIHQQQLRRQILDCMGLWPLPERLPLDIHESRPLEHPWCTVKKVEYQLWPNVYAEGLLYMPKEFLEKPAPAVLCPHGHWRYSYADQQVQKRCLMFAQKGFVVFSPLEDHYEYLEVGLSHQTHDVWRNMRGIDYLQSLPEVDDNRIGVCGASGGGLQTQMLVALDERVKAATMVGATSDYREILFPYATHGVCNHFPGIMKFIDWPEISALGMPAAVQYLTMDDWTAHFNHDNFPTIQMLYNANGYPQRTEAVYWPTAHLYDKPKRERTYWWMEKWVRGDPHAQVEEEPVDIQIFFPEQTLLDLSVEVPNNKNLAELGNIFYEKYKYKRPQLSNITDWRAYQGQMIENLKDLLGEDVKVAPENSQTETVAQRTQDGLIIEQVIFPSEGSIMIPSLIIYPENVRGKLPVILILSEAGKDHLLAQAGEQSPIALAQKGNLVVLPDIRFVGELSLSALTEFWGPNRLNFKAAYPLDLRMDMNDRVNETVEGWVRNSIVWGRSLAGMAVTDIQAVLDGVSQRSQANMETVSLIARNSGLLAVVGLFAAVLDKRISCLDLDFANACFESKNVGYYRRDKNGGQRHLPLVPLVLRYGDILQWSSLLADRNLTIRNVPSQAGDSSWLQNVFHSVGNSGGLQEYSE